MNEMKKIIFMVLMVVLWYTHLVLYVLPAVVRKIDSELQQHLASETTATGQSS